MTRAAPPVVHRLLAGWHRAECVLAVAAFGAVALLLIADVVARELVQPLARVFGAGAAAIAFPSTPKLALYALVAATYAGIGVAAATATHFVPRAGFGWVGARFAPLVDRCGDLVTAMVWLAAAGYAAEFVAGSRATGLRAPLLDWPVWPVQLALPLGFASAALRYLCFAAWPDTRPRRNEVAS
jgi:TRAP-type C4-dicarboxylate transport system permease small subunit